MSKACTFKYIHIARKRESKKREKRSPRGIGELVERDRDKALKFGLPSRVQFCVIAFLGEIFLWVWLGSYLVRLPVVRSPIRVYPAIHSPVRWLLFVYQFVHIRNSFSRALEGLGTWRPVRVSGATPFELMPTNSVILSVQCRYS